MYPILGQIILFAGAFTPDGWAKCDGQLMAVSDNGPLFSLIGNIYGGDGRTTFALPDLRGRVPMNWGQGPGLSLRRIGQFGGVENVELSTINMPAHVHELENVPVSGQIDVGVNFEGADTFDPQTGVLTAGEIYSSAPSAGRYNHVSANLKVNGSTTASGYGEAHTNMSPFLCLTYIISLDGQYPDRA